ncbi:MAG: DegQ family serine endoprotease [Pirellulaceae bacterium]|nr:DegQ family serine endoprotease [Pirellulaceae bacterium]
MLRFPRSLLWVLTAVIGGAVGAGIVMLRSETKTSWSYAAEGREAAAARSELARADYRADDLTTAFRTVAKAMRPSVVSVSTVKHVRPRALDRGRERARPQVPEQFRDFFGDELPFDRFFEMPNMPEGFDQEGLGSGVIVSSDGYILTNNHVVRGADEVNVTLSDRRTIPAKVVGMDPKTDVAVLKVEAQDLVPAPLGNSDAAEVGEWVLAVGSPFGLDQTVTAGIISAKSRQMDITDYEDFIQTDAAINPGNSGGPLVNLKGQVIGINTAIASRTGGNNGVGFAIPSNLASSIMDAIVKHGRVQRGRLGALIQDLNEDLAKSFNFDSTKGVLIGDVVDDSPAKKAGLKAGDIVLEFNGKPMESANQLRMSVASTPPGTSSELTIVRNGKRQTIKITTDELSDDVAKTGPSGAAEESSADFGLTVQTLTPELADQLGYDQNQQGVVITAVDPNSMAARTGLRPRDLVVDVDGTAVRNLRDFREAMAKADTAKGVRLQVMRDGSRRFVFLKSSR